MQYRIECIQTVFGEERERRLKLAFDIIWNLDLKKRRAGQNTSKSQNTELSRGDILTDETEEESKEDKDTLSDATDKL